MKTYAVFRSANFNHIRTGGVNRLSKKWMLIEKYILQTAAVCDVPITHHIYQWSKRKLNRRYMTKLLLLKSPNRGISL